MFGKTHGLWSLCELITVAIGDQAKAIYVVSRIKGRQKKLKSQSPLWGTPVTQDSSQ